MQDVLKHTILITQAIRICLAKKVHFAVYKLPGDPGITLVVQKDPAAFSISKLSESLPEKGFLIAPFSRNINETYLIRPDLVIRNSVSHKQQSELIAFPDNSLNMVDPTCPSDTDKNDYIQLVQQSIEKINRGEFEKVVLSRVKSVQGMNTEKLPEVFHVLCDSYPDAFVYMFCVNGQIWTGATPEPFICSRQDELITVSLAGTRPYSEEDLKINRWNSKELLEQEYVTLHIEEVLKNYNISSFAKKGPYVAKAGNLLHLRTDFTFSKYTIGKRLPFLINALHPTPAICGMTTGKALIFINQAEKHDREYYTGFLGPVGMDDLIHLYVNLRCLKVYNNRFLLFTGGGITHDSVAQDEWEETEIKADTLLTALKKIR
jgi:isochorismate synthase